MPVAGVTGQSPTTDLVGIYGNKEEKDKPPDNSLGKDAFLKLLVAQLKYQDPMNPSKSEDFIATTAQFTMVEKLDELTELTRSNAATDSLTTASALIGKEVTVTGPDGRPQTSLVRRTQLIGGEVMVITDLGSVALNQIIGIGAVGSSQANPVSKTEPTTKTEPVGTEPVETEPKATEPVVTGQPVNDGQPDTATDSSPTIEPITEAETDPPTQPPTDTHPELDTNTTTDTVSTDSDSAEPSQEATPEDLPTETTGTDATEPVNTNTQDISNPQDNAPVAEGDNAATVTNTSVSTEES